MVAVVSVALRDRAFGRYYAKRGASRVLREAEEAKPNRERIAHWRNRMMTVPLEHTLPQRMRKS